MVIKMIENIIKYIEDGRISPEKYGVYPRSVHNTFDGSVFMADFGEYDVIVSNAALGFTGEKISADREEWIVSAADHAAAVRLRELFPFTAPVSVLSKDRTVGVGDRLGIATPGHIRVFEKYDAFPVFAQQSIRELTLTSRTFEQVLDSATFAVFRENYTRGFGADGDHLKTEKEVEYAISCGYTMITLDCSEHIRNDVTAMSAARVDAEYTADSTLEEKYLGKSFDIDGMTVSFDAESFKRMRLIYDKAIDFAVLIYNKFFAGREGALDFEVSIDETATPTDPAQHFYVANELISRGVKPATVAPRFCGEFQKGIDYIGDIEKFEKEFSEHAKIAKYFGYKISVHSGSDKFSVFSAVGKYTEGRFHLKTAGTNWLEAMAVIAHNEPALYREIHAYALDYAFEKATAYYHVTTDLTKIPALDTLTDEQLPSLFENNDSRQLIHITYGLILGEKNADGTPRFYNRLYSAWRKYANEYAKRLDKHISRHLIELYRK